jgi:hypothetical protein
MSDAKMSPEGILQLGLGFWASKTLLSAVELGVFTALAGAPQDLDSLRTRLGLHPRSASDFLDALVALRLLEREGGVYRNAPAAELYLDRGKAFYIGGLLEMANRRLYPFWGHLTEALQTGQPQNEARVGGQDLFDAIYRDPDTLKVFLAAMTGVSRPNAQALAAAFPWSEVTSFADIGCAQGGCTAVIARAHPHLQGIGFDLPPVGPIFEAFVRAEGVGDRVTFQAGSFFTDELPEAEVLIMGHILHDWDLPTKQMLLAKAYRALPSGGALIVYDALIDDDRRENAFGLLMSLNMLIETAGGFDYTGAQCTGWMQDAGFHEVRIQPLAGPHSMAVARK